MSMFRPRGILNLGNGPGEARRTHAPGGGWTPPRARALVIVWRSVSFPGRYYVSTRPEGQRWTTHNTVLDVSALSTSGRLYRGNPVAMEVDLPLGP